MAFNSQRMLSLWLPRLSTDRIARSRNPAARPRAPSPRLRGEGRGEGAFRQAQTRGHPPSPAFLCSASAGDLSPQAGRGQGGLVVYGKRGNADVLTAVDDNAARCDLSVGIALAQARAMHAALE